MSSFELTATKTKTTLNIKKEKVTLTDLDKNYRLVWVYFIFDEEDGEMISYCKLKGKFTIYIKYCLTTTSWYTHNPKVFSKELKKDIDIENYQLFLDLCKQNHNLILLTVKSAQNNNCTKCLVETVIFPNIFLHSFSK